MNTIDKKNNAIKENRDPRNQHQNNGGKMPLLNDEFYDIDDMKEEDSSNKENAERGYTVRNGHNPNKPNPDEFTAEDDLDDDFHSKKDLEDNSDYVYEVELEEDENDEFDNPSDVLEDDFNEEDDLDQIDQEEEEDEYIEDDVQEDEEENYPDNDPRKF